MSIIEQAVKRLDQLKNAGGDGLAEDGPLGAAVERQPAAAAKPVVAPASPAVARVPAKTVHIDLARLAARGLVTPDQPRSAIAEEFRLIKRPLLGNAVQEGQAAVDNGNLILISSALPGEGKTFNAINLAISMAMELDYTVLLVDADVSRPSVLRELDLPPQAGLMDVLAGEVSDLSEVLLKTNIDKLTLLPAGMPHQRATELLASDAMEQLLGQIAHRYADRIIVFDSPPLLVTTESRVLATHMGQVVLVVEAERTTHAQVNQALAAIEPCPIRMMVLNKSRQRSVGGYYGYGYGYGQGQEHNPEAA
jgi:receptor protein-tyrosine kinase